MDLGRIQNGHEIMVEFMVSPYSSNGYEWLGSGIRIHAYAQGSRGE